jgi:hypothetical protein
MVMMALRGDDKVCAFITVLLLLGIEVTKVGVITGLLAKSITAVLPVGDDL